MKRPEPVLLGFFPKERYPRDDWFKNPAVEEICSVSTCIAKGPEGWIDRWKHDTTWWLFPTEAAAWEVVGDERSRFALYAYRLFPVVFDGDGENPIPVESAAQGGLDGFEFLGYDMVSRSCGTNFECSPLSCNNGCEQYPVNRCCLIESLEEAWRITREIARSAKEKGDWETGPYYLLEVHRRR